MIIDFKYHIASLVAVFLSLGLGILVGSTMIGSDIIAQQQKEIVSKLELDFGKLRTENMTLHIQLKDLDNRLATEKQFQELSLPILLAQRLAGKQVVLLFTDLSYTQGGLEKELSDNLQKAGAKIHSSVFLSGSFISEDKNKQLEKQFVCSNKRKKLSFLAKQLVMTIKEKKNAQAMLYLEKLGMAKISIFSQNNPDSVVIIGGSSLSSNADLDRILIKECQKAGWKVVATEPMQSKISFMSFYQRMSVSTIDNIDTIPGQVSLVLALQQDKQGNYGVKSTAEKFLPDLF